MKIFTLTSTIILTLLMMLIPVTVYAKEKMVSLEGLHQYTAGAIPPPGPAPSPISKTLLVLTVEVILLGGMIFGTVYAFKRIRKKRASVKNQSSYFRVIETHSLASKQKVYVIEALGEILLVGATDQAISTLCQVTDPELKASLLQKPEFQMVLKDLMKNSSFELSKKILERQTPEASELL